jgi:RimJ/RimL family protein N-acetyltransferase
MLHVDRTENEQLVWSVVTDVWGALEDDAKVNPIDWKPRIDDESRWYASYTDEDEIVGVYWARKINHVTWEVHTNVRRKFWGSGEGLPHSRAALAHIIQDTGARKIVAVIPESSPQVLKVADTLGFKREGRREKSFQKDGVLYDEIYFGLSIGNDL